MSEVLPRPTPLSFSIMSMLWAAGGSVDQACRALGLRYRMPETESGHLYRLFGKVYSDTALKAAAALRLPRSVERTLEKRCGRVEENFHRTFLPALHKELAYAEAVDVSKLDLENRLEFAKKLTRYFVEDVYVMAEQVNILASFLNLKAEAECRRQGLDVLQVLQSSMAHSPNQMMANALGLPDAKRKEYLLQTMGHRALFDYELSMPRYSETPEVLWKLAQTTVHPLHMHKVDAPGKPALNVPNVVELALRFQDLKEQAKHEALRVYAVLRKVLLAIDDELGGEGLVFHLEYPELLSCCDTTLGAFKEKAANRMKIAEIIREMAPSRAAMSLHDCELLSNPTTHVSQSSGDMQGICVSGDKDVVGTVFWAEDTDFYAEADLVGFTKGDILVCKMMNPAWLPYVLQSGAVICEVGGWLSHMAIVAREHNVPMIVGCTGLERLQNGDQVTVSRTGQIGVCALDVPKVALKAEAG
jgi:phosphohistidine swiveling domain-containing protein